MPLAVHGRSSFEYGFARMGKDTNDIMALLPEE